MANSALGSLVEFLIGWWVLPKIVFFVFGFVFAFFKFTAPQILLYMKIVEVAIILILFRFRKAMALGYLVDFLIGVFAVKDLLLP